MRNKNSFSAWTKTITQCTRRNFNTLGMNKYCVKSQPKWKNYKGVEERFRS